MADKRMLTRKVTDSDDFIALPSSTQCLYMHLNQCADDDGFNNQIQMAMFKAHASIDDVKLLLTKRFILEFNSGVIVIKHWRMANALRKDRYTPTVFKEEFAKLHLKDNLSYTENNVGCQMVAKRLPNGCHSIGKDSIDKDSIDKNSINILSGKNPDCTSEKPEYKVIIDYLNETIGANYKYTSKPTREKINARLKEGFTVDDFKKVIDKKHKQWKNSNMAKFLRPDTLFSTKFEGYLNEKEKDEKHYERYDDEC